MVKYNFPSINICSLDVPFSYTTNTYLFIRNPILGYHKFFMIDSIRVKYWYKSCRCRHYNLFDGLVCHFIRVMKFITDTVFTYTYKARITFRKITLDDNIFWCMYEVDNPKEANAQLYLNLSIPRLYFSYVVTENCISYW